MIHEHTVTVRTRNGQQVFVGEADRTLYTLAELEELHPRAWQKVYERWLQGALDYEWWDSVYDDAVHMAEILGIEIDSRRGTGSAPCIWFSSFSSQGDGACWEGSYKYAKGAHRRIRKEAPKDTELHRIADELLEVQRQNGYGLSATSVHRGSYSHSGTMRIEVECEVRGCRRDVKDEDEQTIEQALRDFADWIYRQLGQEADYLQSEEQFKEACADNLFDEDGRRA